MRVESDQRTSDLTTIDSTVRHSFVNPFPSIHLSYAFRKSEILKLSYSRRVSRPKPRELDPFAEYRDPRNLVYGNPMLLPEYTNSFEAGYHLHRGAVYLQPTLFYRYATNSITSIKQLVNRSTLETRWTNANSDYTTGLEFVGSYDADVFTADLSATALYEELDATNIDQGYFTSGVSWNGTLTCNVDVARSTRLQLHSHVNGTRLTPQGKHFPSWTVNVGVRQGFLDGKLTLTATGSDLFKTLVRHYELDVPDLRQEIFTTRESRIFFIGFTYRFGSVATANEEDQMHYDDEQ
jgi:outer membrane receptor protein involved in Fe transport